MHILKRVGDYILKIYKKVVLFLLLLYTKISSIELIDKTIESESITKFDPIFNIDQTYFEDEATFVQKVEANNIISTYNVKVE